MLIFLIQTIYRLLGTALFSAVLTFSLIKLYQKFANKPTKRQVIPPLGGIAIFISFWAGFFSLFPSLMFNSSQWNTFLASGIILLTGIIDDQFVLNPRQKSVGILLAANVIYFMADIEFSTALLPAISPNVFNILSYVLTIAWIYFVTNAINLLDGLDGLASSVSVVSLLTLAITTYYFSLSIRIVVLMMLLLLAASIIGFLPFNWFPARIYLGDTGALFIGFMYATLTVTNLKNASFFSLIIPIILYIVPLFDTSFAIFRRLMTGRSLIERDEDHIHHRLLRLGMSEPQVVLIMLGTTLVFSILAILSHAYPHWRNYILGAVIFITAVMFVAMLKLSDTRKK